MNYTFNIVILGEMDLDKLFFIVVQYSHLSPFWQPQSLQAQRHPKTIRLPFKKKQFVVSVQYPY